MTKTSEKLRVFFGASLGFLFLTMAGVATPSSFAATPTASKTQLTTESVVVTAIDRSKRSVTLQNPDGETKSVHVPEEIKAFETVKVGDHIDIDYYESVQLTMLPAGTKPTMSETEAGGRTADGRAVGREMQVSGTITGIDAKNNKVTIKGPRGNSKTVTVQDPDVQKKLPTMKVGQVVQLTYTEAIAASIRPGSKMK